MPQQTNDTVDYVHAAGFWGARADYNIRVAREMARQQLAGFERIHYETAYENAVTAGHCARLAGHNSEYDFDHSDRTINALAAEFDQMLRRHMAARDYVAACRANARQHDEPTCATHDYIDSNETMAVAFANVFGRAPLASSDLDAGIINDAWDTWREERTAAITFATDDSRANGPRQSPNGVL